MLSDSKQHVQLQLQYWAPCVMCYVIIYWSYKVWDNNSPFVVHRAIINWWDPVQRLTAVVDDDVRLESGVFICNIVLHSRCCVSCFHLFYQCQVPVTQGYLNTYLHAPSPNPSNILPGAGPRSCGIGPIHFLCGWHMRHLNQALFMFLPTVTGETALCVGLWVCLLSVDTCFA